MCSGPTPLYCSSLAIPLSGGITSPHADALPWPSFRVKGRSLGDRLGEEDVCVYGGGGGLGQDYRREGGQVSMMVMGKMLI